MGLIDDFELLFGTADVYSVLGVPRTSTDSQVKKAYYKLSLTIHPDKVDEKDKKDAGEKFKVLSKFYSVLSDKNKRKAYDKTGEVGDEDDFGLNENQTWTDYWRELFPVVTETDITRFESDFKGSEEELTALTDAYEQHKGDMQKILETVMCATMVDEDRFRKILTEKIENGQLKSYKKFTNESTASKKKRMDKAKKEAKEAAKAKADFGELAMALQRNKERRGGIIAILEEKYKAADAEEAGKKRRKSTKTPTSKKRKSDSPSSTSTGAKKRKTKSR